MNSPCLRRLWASPFLLAALWGAALSAGAADIVRRPITAADYEAVRQALVESIEGEGLVPGPVSQFGDMLQRTAGSLGHGADLYARAEIFSFCSIIVSARLVREHPERIADCPLTIALYRMKGSGEVSLAFRPREDAAAANELMGRIVERTAAQFK